MLKLSRSDGKTSEHNSDQSRNVGISYLQWLLTKLQSRKIDLERLLISMLLRKVNVLVDKRVKNSLFVNSSTQHCTQEHNYLTVFNTEWGGGTPNITAESPF